MGGGQVAALLGAQAAEVFVASLTALTRWPTALAVSCLPLVAVVLAEQHAMSQNRKRFDEQQ